MKELAPINKADGERSDVAPEVESQEAVGAPNETRELPPDETVARLIVVRHFPSLYQESKGLPTEKYDLVNTPEQLGKNAYKAKRLAKIFHDEDVVAFWSSPLKRAQGTKEVLKAKTKRPIVKEKTISSLQGVRVPPDQYETFTHENVSRGWFSVYQETPSEGRAGETRVESVEEVGKRFNRVFQAFNRFVHTRLQTPGEKNRRASLISLP